MTSILIRKDLSSTDLFQMIESAIKVAAINHPEEFEAKSHHISQILQPSSVHHGDEDTVMKKDRAASDGEKNMISNFVLLKEVTRIKEQLIRYNRNPDPSTIDESALLQLLQSLERIPMSMVVLFETLIAKAVSSLARNHKTSYIHVIAENILREWEYVARREVYKTKDAMSLDKIQEVVKDIISPPHMHTSDETTKMQTGAHHMEEGSKIRRRIMGPKNDDEPKNHESSKRKLPQGYEIAQHAKKWRSNKQ